MMGPFKKLCSLALGFSFFSPLPAQEGLPGGGSAPQVTQIRAEQRGRYILLTWKDVPGLDKVLYHVYASTRPIDPATREERILLGSIKPGGQSLLFEPRDEKGYYFLVLVEDQGELYQVFRPYSNATVLPVSARVDPPPLKRDRHVISFSATPRETDIYIEAELSDYSRRTTLFRSLKPIRTREDLLYTVRLQTFQNQEIIYRDPVPPEIRFYYALVDEELYRAGYTENLLYQTNTLEVPVFIPLEGYVFSGTFSYMARSTPLPRLNIDQDIERGQSLPGRPPSYTPLPLSYESEEALRKLNKSWKREVPLLPPEVLPIDTVPSPPPETAWVYDLLDKRNWAELAQRCSEALATTSDTEVKSRLYFYRGQSYYYLGQLENAFMDFLSARDSYFLEASRWMENIYDLRREKPTSP